MDLFPLVFRTEGDLTEFNSSRILDSIIKETGLNVEDANKITELVVRRIVSSGIKFLSGPHIREIVCSILSEQHFENERKLYTRIGIPLMDYEKILESFWEKKQGQIVNPEKIHHWAANRISEEYAHLRILSSEESKAHLNGDINIDKLRYFDLRPLSQLWDPRIILQNGVPPFTSFNQCCSLKPAKNFKTALHHLIKWIMMTQNEFSGSQGFNFLTPFLAPYAKGISENELKLIIKNSIFEINQISTITSRKVSPISFLVYPTSWEALSKLRAIGPQGKLENLYETYQQESLKIFNALTQAFKEGDDNNNSFKTPQHEILIDNKWFDKYEEISSNITDEINTQQTPFLLNSKTFSSKNKNIVDFTESEYRNFGILQEVCINLPRLAYLSKEEDKFFELVNSTMNLCSQILVKKYKTIKKRLNSNFLPFCGGIVKNNPIFKLEEQFLSLSFVGLNEALKILTDFELHDNTTAFHLGKRIVGKMNKICLEFSKRDNLSYLLSENLSKKTPFRFARLDKKHFPKMSIPQFNPDIYYYTNSLHFRKNSKIDLLEKLRKQEEFHILMQNGAIEYVSLTELKENDITLENLIKQFFIGSELVNLKFYSDTRESNREK